MEEEKEGGRDGHHRGYHFMSLRSHCCDSSPVHGPETERGAKRLSFTCAKHTGHHLYMLSPEILCCPIKNVLS